MGFLIGAVTGSFAALILSTIVYQSNMNELLKRYGELTKLIWRFNNEYNR